MIMEGKISKDGFLKIKRVKGFIEQKCPFSDDKVNPFSASCGHWCPLFGEPENTDSYINLAICHTVLQFRKNNFMDER